MCPSKTSVILKHSYKLGTLRNTLYRILLFNLLAIFWELFVVYLLQKEQQEENISNIPMSQT